jgi:hypothetical protein
MPANPYGQQITFAIDQDQDWPNLNKWLFIPLHNGDTVQKVAARRGHPWLARQIAQRNNIRSLTKVLKHKDHKKGDRRRIRVPGKLRGSASFNVLAGDSAPVITGGYAKFSILDRPERAGLTTFDGYDPITMDVPIRFENYQGRLDDTSGASGEQIETDIELLERMAGRGPFSGAAIGPPPIVVVTTTNDDGRTVNLIPRGYQRTKTNPHAPRWRVTAIAWDGEPLRNSWGNRIRQKATVTLQQHTKITLATARK